VSPRARRLVPLAFAAVAVVFFAAPIALRAVGVRARPFENTTIAPAPRLADGWDVFDETTRFLIDRMPLRQQAVRANTWISEHVFASTPQYGQNGLGGVASDQALPFSGHPEQDRGSAKTSPAAVAAASVEVIAGTHGWLYLQDVFDRACHEFVPVDTATARWLALIRLIRASGRRVVLVVAPDKSTVYPGFVKASTPNLACSRTGEAALWDAIGSTRARRAGVIGLRRALLADKARTPAQLYFRKDSHWTAVGALALVRRVVPALDPRVHVLGDEVRDSGPMTYTGDLTLLLGAPATDRAPTRAIRRARGAARIPGDALLVDDSFGQHAFPLLAPYFADLHQAAWSVPATILQQLPAARTVVLEVVERQFDFGVSRIGFVTPAFVRSVRAALSK
jgi:alginate O-acetyltransferase complex protein AlgJ